MELFIVLFFVSIPIFWLYGIISFLRNFTSKNQSASNSSLIQEFLSDLEQLKSKQTSISLLLDKYKQRLTGVSDIVQTGTPAEKAGIGRIISEEAVPTSTPALASSTSSINVDINDWWEGWYRENNINLLLYIGAFLIVSSAAIFVGFNWETFTGTFKAMVLSLITIAFFAAGFFFYYETPKLRNAGATFLAIGSLLIPFNGLAWYNFVLRDSGMGFGGVWLLTSLVAVIVYFILAYIIQNRFYTYIAGLGGLSLVESLVNVSSLDSQYYILGGIFSAFVLLAGSKFIASTRKEEFEEVYSQPLTVSSNIVMPIFLTWGLSVAYSSDRLFTPEATASVFLAAVYYFLSYLISKNISIFTLAELLTALTIVLTTKTLGYSGAPVFYTIFATSFVFIAGSYYLKQLSKNQESYYSNFVAIFVSLLSLAIAFVDPLVSPVERFYFILIVSTLTLGAAYIEKIPTYLYLTVGGVNLSALVYVSHVQNRSDWFNYLGLFYFLFGTALVLFGNYILKSRPTWAEVLINFSLLNLLLGVIFCLQYPEYLTIISLLTLLVAALNSYYFQATKGYYNYVSSIIISLIALTSAFGNIEVTNQQRVYYSLIVSVIAGLSSYLERKGEYLYVSILAIDLGTYLYIVETTGNTNLQNYLGIFYLFFAVIIYSIGQYFWQSNRRLSEVLMILTAVNFGFALMFTAGYPGQALLTSLTIALVLGIASYLIEKDELGYLGVVFLVLSTLNFLRATESTIQLYPFAFAILGYLVYLTNLLQLPDRYKEISRNSGVIITSATPVVFGIIALGGSYPVNNDLEFNSLISAYAATALLTFDAATTNRGLGYVASVAGLLTLLWQYKYLNVTETQVYSGTIGLYFLGLSYVKKLQNKLEDQRLFDMIGLAVLLIPLSLQAFPVDGYWYALILGTEGAILILAGFSLNHKTYTYAGAAAICVATLTRIYSYISSLPSWAVIGLGGLLFLSVAIYLLNKRNL